LRETEGTTWLVQRKLSYVLYRNVRTDAEVMRDPAESEVYVRWQADYIAS
jgi:hypothetical protein